MRSIVIISKSALKSLRKVPRHILIQFDLWIEVIEVENLYSMQKIKGYRDHALHGNRQGQRSSSLSISWRIIYRVFEEDSIITVEVLEVNHHDY